MKIKCLEKNKYKPKKLAFGVHMRGISEAENNKHIGRGGVYSVSTQKPLKIKIYDHFIAFSLPFRTRLCSNGGSLAHGLRNLENKWMGGAGRVQAGTSEDHKISNYDIPTYSV